MLLLIFGFCCGVYVGVKHADKLKLSWPDWLKLPPYIQVVEANGRYAVRRGYPPFYRYADFQSPGYWWSRSSTYYFRDCWTSSLDKAKESAQTAKERVVA